MLHCRRTLELLHVLRGARLGLLYGGPDDPPDRRKGGSELRTQNSELPPGSRAQLKAKIAEVLAALMRRAREGDTMAMEALKINRDGGDNGRTDRSKPPREVFCRMSGCTGEVEGRTGLCEMHLGMAQAGNAGCLASMLPSVRRRLQGLPPQEETGGDWVGREFTPELEEEDAESRSPRRARREDPKPLSVPEPRHVDKTQEQPIMAETQSKIENPKSQIDTCRVPGCERPVKRRGVCNAHYIYTFAVNPNLEKVKAIRAAMLPPRSGPRKKDAEKGEEPAVTTPAVSAPSRRGKQTTSTAVSEELAAIHALPDFRGPVEKARDIGVDPAGIVVDLLEALGGEYLTWADDNGRVWFRKGQQTGARLDRYLRVTRCRLSVVPA